MRRSSIRSALVGAVLLAALAARAGRRRTAQDKQPTARGTRRRRRDRRPARHRRGDRRARATAATPSTRPSPRPRVLGVTEPFSCGIGGGGFMVIRTRRRARSRRSTRARRRPATMQPRLVHRERRAARRSTTRATAGSRAGVPGTPRDVGPRAAQVRHALARAGAGARRSTSRARASWSTRRSSTRSTPNDAVLRRHPVDRGALPRPRRHAAATSARRSRNPDLARTYELHRPQRRAQRLLPRRRSPTRSSQAAAQNPPIAPTADHTWRPGLMTTRRPRALHGARARARRSVSYRGLDVYGMGPPSCGGSTVGEALNILERLHARRRDADAGAAPLPRGVALAFADRNAYLADPAFFDVPGRGPARPTRSPTSAPR